ncbi:MAG TPA: FAD-binding oxidoreductase [Candidatus Udaeobacter sp.]|nr:FAD-binding oxidoreductase [Candidatus Udaeobacter sp.]
MRAVWRTDADYEATRRRMVWQKRIPDRFPDVIVTVVSDADVIEAVKLARSRGLRISVRAGGHSWIATSLRDGGMLIDLSQLNGVTVDAEARTAIAQPAIKNTEVMAVLSRHGLAFPAGHCPTVALGGYLLSGGQGWNQGTWGIACKNVTAIDLVNADGDLITADAQQNTDLLWASRGGGPGFPGVILRYHLRLFPAPKSIMQSLYVYPLDLVESIASWLAQTVASLPASLEQLLLMGLAPPVAAAQLRHPRRRHLTLWPVTYGDSADETMAALAPLENCPVIDQALVRQANTPVSWDDLFAVEAAVFPEGYRYDVGIIWSDADPAAVLGGLRDRLAETPSIRTEILGAVTGPPTIDPSAREMAYSMAAPLYIGSFTIWENPEDDEANQRWHRDMLRSLEPVTRGHYMGETDLTASPTRARDSLAPGVWERLKAIRQRHDPAGVFYSHIGQS